MSTVNDIAAIDQTGAPYIVRYEPDSAGPDSKPIEPDKPVEYIIRVEPDGSRHAVPLNQAGVIPDAREPDSAE